MEECSSGRDHGDFTTTAPSSSPRLQGRAAVDMSCFRRGQADLEPDWVTIRCTLDLSDAVLKGSSALLIHSRPERNPMVDTACLRVEFPDTTSP